MPAITTPAPQLNRKLRRAMARQPKTRPARPERPVFVNAVEVAINKARKLSAADVAGQVRIVSTALQNLKLGTNARQQWNSLADTANMAETFEQMGLGSGPAARAVINDAQRALAAILQRHRTRGTWALYAAEIDHLTWLVALHAQQLGACSYGEFETALDRTKQRLAQALKGNAPRGAILTIGDIAP